MNPADDSSHFRLTDGNEFLFQAKDEVSLVLFNLSTELVHFIFVMLMNVMEFGC